MDDLIEFGPYLQKKIVEVIMKEFGKINDEASTIASLFYNEFVKNPRTAFMKLPNFLNKTKDINPYMLASDPNQDWNAPMYNLIGSIYPDLGKNERSEALAVMLDYFDGINYLRTQDHVELIHEPWLCGDILANRSLYWPGVKYSIGLIESSDNFSELDSRFQSIISSQFLFTYALLATERTKSCLDIRFGFYKKYPQFVDRSLDAIAGMAYEHSKKKSEKEGSNLIENIENNISKFDPHFHDDIMDKIEIRNWISLPKT